MRRRFWPFRTAPALTDLALTPLTQAQRCLDTWLREEGRSMTTRQRQRASALIARYFEHEDAASEQLILSFLRHYGGMGVVDLEDPQAVRQELKAVLDRSTPVHDAAGNGRLRLLIASVTGMIAMASVLVVFYLSQQTLTLAQQHELRAVVAQNADARNVAPATIWAKVKRDLGVARYQDIRRWDFARAMDMAKEN